MSVQPFADSQLPTYPTPTVVLFREQLERFREEYDALMVFAAKVCGVDMRELCRLDMDRWLWEERGEVTVWTVLLAAAAEGTTP